MSKKKIKKTRSITKDSGIKSAREKMIGQHIGYRYDVNLLPDYKKLTPFLKKYIEHMGWDDLNWLEDVHMGYENGKPAVFDRNINGWVTTPPKMKLPKTVPRCSRTTQGMPTGLETTSPTVSDLLNDLLWLMKTDG